MENIKSPETSELNGLISTYSPYLFEVRKRIFFTLIIFVAAAIIGFAFNERIIKLLIDLLQLKGINIVFTSPFQFINLAISCGIVSGIVATFPLLIYQIFSFLRPALRLKEFRMLTGFLPFSIILFLIGFVFGFLIMKWQIQLFLSKSVSLGIGNMLDITRLVSTVIIVSALMGLAFQFPIIILLLMRIGIIKRGQLNKQRQWVYLGSFIFAILLPADSILADILLSLPLIILFELTLIFNRILERRKTI